MMQHAIPVEDIFRKLRPIFGKKVDQLYMQYSLAEDREAREQIERGVKVLYEKYLNTTLLSDSVLLEPPQHGLVEGEYPLGLVSYAGQTFDSFGLREQDWIRHVCVSGMSGSGKTNFAFQILGNFVARKKPFLVFDWKKSFRPLMKMDKQILCFTIGNNKVSNLFRFNICRPPAGVPPKEWISILADLITESYSASFGVHKVLVETLDKAYRDFGVYAGSENYPTVYQLRDRFEARMKQQKGKSREGEWMESAMRIAHSLTFGPFGETIGTKDQFGLKVEDLLGRKVLFELNSLNNSEKKFFCEFILLYLYKYLKVNQHEAKEQFKFAILVDEAHNVFLKDRPNFIKESVTDMVYREIREFGASLICLDQHISKLSDTVAGNSATNVAFQQILPDDVEGVASLMQIRDKRQYFSMLPVGYAIVKLAERYHLPFLVKVPQVGIKQEAVSDDDVKRRMKVLVEEDRRLKQVVEGAKAEAVVASLAKVESIFEKTSVRVPDAKYAGYVTAKMYDGKRQDREAFEEARVAAQEAQDIADGKSSKVYPANHLQADLVELVLRQRVLGLGFDEVKTQLVKAGFGATDVNRAIKMVQQKSQVPEARMASGMAVSKYLRENADAKAFLESVSSAPKPTTAVYKELGLSARKGDSIRRELASLGLIGMRDEITQKGRTRLLYACDGALALVA